ncbi:MAG: hypothetical protein SOR93_19995 [Clostridiales Family XIII bacterium]|nr:hypothetical protein [Clostridiales Family XIII bacterium]
MKIKDFARDMNPYSLLQYTLQNEKLCLSLQRKFMAKLIEKIENGGDSQQIKNVLEDLICELTTDYFAKGVQYGVQLYVAMMGNVEDED